VKGSLTGASINTSDCTFVDGCGLTCIKTGGGRRDEIMVGTVFPAEAVVWDSEHVLTSFVVDAVNDGVTIVGGCSGLRVKEDGFRIVADSGKVSRATDTCREADGATVRARAVTGLKTVLPFSIG
jgi:hypothetical protein